jgi:hypothetical protein
VPAAVAGVRYPAAMRVAVLTFDGFNEIDSFVAAAMFNRVRRPGYVAPVGEQAAWIERAFAAVGPYL